MRIRVSLVFATLFLSGIVLSLGYLARVNTPAVSAAPTADITGTLLAMAYGTQTALPSPTQIATSTPVFTTTPVPYVEQEPVIPLDFAKYHVSPENMPHVSIKPLKVVTIVGNDGVTYDRVVSYQLGIPEDACANEDVMQNLYYFVREMIKMGIPLEQLTTFKGEAGFRNFRMVDGVCTVKQNYNSAPAFGIGQIYAPNNYPGWNGSSKLTHPEVEYEGLWDPEYSIHHSVRIYNSHVNAVDGDYVMGAANYKGFGWINYPDGPTKAMSFINNYGPFESIEVVTNSGELIIFPFDNTAVPVLNAHFAGNPNFPSLSVQ